MPANAPLDARAFVVDLWERPATVLDRHGAAVAELAAMRGCPQPPNHHSEGDVWEHTRLAMEILGDLPAAVHRFAGARLADAGLSDLAFPGRTLTQALGVLLHDVGKPVTVAGDDGAWTYYGHDRVGARMAADLIARLDLVAAAASAGLVVDPDAVAWLVAEHLFWLNTDVGRVTDRAVARRFVRDDGRDEDLRVLAWCDTLGSRGIDGLPHVDLLVAAEGRLRATRARAAAAVDRPPPLLDGREVMQSLDIGPGPRVGAVLAWLRFRHTDAQAARRDLDARREQLRDGPLEGVNPGR
jgi:poly(A) polymerase